jgi:hypothetical protein
MESLLTLSLGNYHAAELALRLTLCLTGMTGLLLLLCSTCTNRQFRFPLILSGVALIGAAWFQSGTWLAWKDAFELAGTSYCVTGHLLAGEDRIIAWALGVPVVLFCFGFLKFSAEKTVNTPSFQLERLAVLLLVLAFVVPFSSILGLLLLGYALYLLCYGTPRAAKATKLASASILLAMIISMLGSFHALPLSAFGKSAEAILIHAEILRSLCDLLSLVIPSMILLTIVLRQEPPEIQPTTESLPPRERKPKPRASDLPDPQSGLFGN